MLIKLIGTENKNESILFTIDKINKDAFNKILNGNYFYFYNGKILDSEIESKLNDKKEEEIEIFYEKEHFIEDYDKYEDIIVDFYVVDNKTYTLLNNKQLYENESVLFSNVMLFCVYNEIIFIFQNKRILGYNCNDKSKLYELDCLEKPSELYLFCNAAIFYLCVCFNEKLGLYTLENGFLILKNTIECVKPRCIKFINEHLFFIVNNHSLYKYNLNGKKIKHYKVKEEIIDYIIEEDVIKINTLQNFYYEIVENHVKPVKVQESQRGMVFIDNCNLSHTFDKIFIKLEDSDKEYKIVKTKGQINKLCKQKGIIYASVGNKLYKQMI
ncbi:hypothetical protein EHP00_741 [Ecytonucleospora hepatopenaei]|uniref:Uncharacterized protein n=1 Tax=Ecytonucleospora hepatopenaei TaxID=646526 RepID=A0A1W0E3A6_9MICR|nr:hypothetical protein EHP00_741 [Ecytonucleospora hepatopenaei]